MSEDFVTQLRLQLREAAEREAQRSPLGRRFGAARGRMPSPAIAAGLAALLAALVVAGLALRGGDGSPAQRGPRVVATLPLVASGGTMATGFGSVWVADSAGLRVLRIDPDTRSIPAAIETSASVTVSTGEGSVWAMDGARGEVLRIDPERERIVARIDLEQRSREAAGTGFVEAREGVVWAYTAIGALRIDPQRNRVVDRVAAADPGLPGFFSLGLGALWHADGSDRVLRLDPRTGEPQRVLRPGQGPLCCPWATGEWLLAGTRDRATVSLDPESGRAIWRRRVDRTPNFAERMGTRLLVHGSDPDRPRDRLTVLDIRSGRLIARLALPEFGATGMAVVGREAWVMTPAGKLLVIR